MLTAVPVEGFGGLNLVSDPEEVGFNGAIDTFNTDLRARDRVGPRKGFSDFTNESETSERYWRLGPFYQTNGARQLCASRSWAFDVFTPAGNRIESVAQTGVAYFAVFGDPTREAVYFGSTGDVIGRYVAASSTTGSSQLGVSMATVDGIGNRSMPKGGPMCVSPIDNRLVVAAPNGGPGGAASDPSRVWFSDEGNPESWQSNNFVDLTPGDGEEIVAVLAWQSYVVVFKQTKYFVFYGTSADSIGLPIFDYRPVDVGIGISLSRGNGFPAIATQRGVFFVNDNGVYLMSGGAPEKVSGAMDPFFRGDVSEFYEGGTFNQGSNGNASLAFYDDRLYLCCRSGTENDRVLVWESRWDWWSVWGLPANTIVPFRTTGDGREELYFSRADSTQIAKIGPKTDDGASVDWRWRTGFSDMGSPVAEKTVSDTMLVGDGEVDFRWSRDFGELGRRLNVQFGDGPARRTVRFAQPGELISFELSGGGEVNRVVPLVREVRPVGERTG